MSCRTLRALLLASSVTLPLAPLSAQQRPSAAEAQILLQTRPDLVAQLRARLQSSGMTPEQVRARLRAEGYPENLLDAYLTQTPGAPAAEPGSDVFAAVRALGVADSLGIDSLRLLAQSRRIAMSHADSAFRDSLRIIALDDTAREAIRQIIRSRDARRSYTDSGFTLFGRDVFERETSQFDPVQTGPVGPSYRLGPGDQLVLILTGDVEASHALDVTREGFVAIPQVGQVQVTGLTLGQLEDVLYSRLRLAYSGMRRDGSGSTRFSVSVARIGTNQVYVLGDVQRPSLYRVSRTGTALTALYAAGGPSENGNWRNVQVRRGADVVGTVDLYDYLLKGTSANDVRLENGDVVFLPPRGARVRIAGAVLRPGIYEMKDGETLADLVRFAGGVTPEADRRRAQVERVVPQAERAAHGERRVVEIESDDVLNGSGSREALMAGDVVRIFELPGRAGARVTVSGNVWRPGSVGQVPGMTVTDAIRQVGGLRPDSYLGEVLITRVLPDSSRVQLRAQLRDTTGAMLQPMPLERGDEIRVFSLTEFRPKRYVAISGAVRNGGRFAYHDGMTLRDLVLLAGGVEEGALLTEAEIARLPVTRAGGATATTVRVPLDSTYLFEQPTDGVAFQQAKARDVPLQSYDNVLILRQPNWELQRTVVIDGEVTYPGRYTLKNKDERLMDVINRAGGLTPGAYAGGVVFYRPRNGFGRIGLDLPAVLRNPKHVDNLTLLDGDSIHVPLFTPVVNVRGAVNSSVALSYVRGANLDYYVRAAGGASRRGDAGGAYVMQPNGKVETRRGRWIFPDAVPKPQPGSTVVVPEQPEGRRDYLVMAGAITQVMASLVAVIAVLHR